MALSYKMEGLFYLRKHLGTRTKPSKCPKSSQSLQSASSPLTLTRTKKIFPRPRLLPLSPLSPKNPLMPPPPLFSTKTFLCPNPMPFTFQMSSTISIKHSQTIPVTANTSLTALESGPPTLFSPSSTPPTATIDWWDPRLSSLPARSKASNRQLKTYRNQTKSNNRISTNSCPEWNPADLGIRSNKQSSTASSQSTVGLPTEGSHTPVCPHSNPYSYPLHPNVSTGPPVHQTHQPHTMLLHL